MDGMGAGGMGLSPFDPGAGAAGGLAEAVPNDRFERVDTGETLWSIARKWYGDGAWWRRVWYANRLVVPDPDRLRVGQRLLVPFGAFGYVIHSGDTLWEISDAVYRNGNIWPRI